MAKKTKKPRKSTVRHTRAVQRDRSKRPNVAPPDEQVEQLPAVYIAALYLLRWRIEDAFNIAKRLLGLAYFWNGSQQGVRLQIWATWILYAILVDLMTLRKRSNVPLRTSRMKWSVVVSTTLRKPTIAAKQMILSPIWSTTLTLWASSSNLGNGQRPSS
jgi:hypothetical protein